jgi:hypothetical protein
VNDANIIIVFEGIHLFKDPETGEESNISLWLPRVFPKRIKVIVSCENGTQAMKYFQNSNLEIVEVI